MNGLRFDVLDKNEAQRLMVANHYLHRRTNIINSFGIFRGEECVGAVTFGAPPSRHLQVGMCRANPNMVIELNRLWVADAEPRNTESWFVAQALRLLPCRIVVSYADSAHKHSGFIYRALNFYFAGLTDMDRKTPRYDYIVPGKHSRSAFRSGDGANAVKIRRLPKWRYWTVTGDRRARRDLERLALWPKLSWKDFSVAATA